MRPADPVMRDRLLAGVAFAAMAAELLAGGGSASDQVRCVLFAALIAAPVLWWRTRPELAAIGVPLALAIGNAGAAPDRLSDASTTLIPLVIAIFGLAFYSTGRPLRLASAASIVLLCVAAALGEGDVAGNIFFAVAFVFAPAFLAGRVLRSRTVLNHELAVRARQLEEEREQRIQRAALQERVRIAGELHDVVAHGVSSMVVQAAAARRLAPRDTASAEQAIVLIEQTGREALLEMRRLLGVLRRGDEDLALAPTPSLARVGALVERARSAGRDVSLTVEGAAVPLPAGLDVAGYRVLEEALAGAPLGPAAVSVRWGERDLELEVRADGGGGDGLDGEGQALLGLRERVALFGGELEAGRDGAAYAVRVRLPVPGAAAG